MTWGVEYTDGFGRCWNTLDAAEQESVDAYVRLLEARGPHLPFPFSADIVSSRHGRVRELRIQHRGKPYRILYAFDPRRIAILLVGGNKTGHDMWYEESVRIADQLYDEHLEELKNQGSIDG